MKTEYKILKAAHLKYMSAIGSMESILQTKCDFRIGIEYQPSDGFVLVDTDNANNAPLKSCMEIINTKGRLSHEDYMRQTI